MKCWRWRYRRRAEADAVVADADARDARRAVCDDELQAVGSDAR